MAGWLIGDCVFVCLFDRLVSWLIDRLVAWVFSCLVGFWLGYRLVYSVFLGFLRYVEI